VRQLYDRVAGLLRELLGDRLGGDRLGSSPGRRLILVTHGGPIRVAQAYLAGLGAGEMAWPHCAQWLDPGGVAGGDGAQSGPADDEFVKCSRKAKFICM
jgi:hypothetical protein